VLRSASILDLPFIASLQGQALGSAAVTLESLTGGHGIGNSFGLLVTQGLMKRSRRHAVVVTSQGRAVGFGIVRRRMGLSCWEVEWAEVAKGAEAVWPELLEGLSGPVSIQGGQRLLLRLADGSPIDRAAQQAEFRPYCREEHYALTVRIQDEAGATEFPGLRPAAADDELGLYQLYRASAPPQVRDAEGVTIDQWKESRPALAGWHMQGEFICEREGRIIGWSAATRRGDTAFLGIVVAGANGDVARALTAAAMREAQGASSALCLMPGHQHSAAAALQANGFAKRGDYTLYVKHVTARVGQPEIAMARA